MFNVYSSSDIFKKVKGVDNRSKMSMIGSSPFQTNIPKDWSKIDLSRYVLIISTNRMSFYTLVSVLGSLE